MLKFLLIFLISFEVYGACTSATRSNYTTGQKLTSSQLNLDFNTIYNQAGAIDGGCLSSGTVEAASLNSTEFGPILKAIVQGCELSYVDSNTVGVSKCKIAVDGNLFETATQSNITWGGSGFAAEATGSFYVYIKDTTTFTPIISSTAPGKDGYSGTDKAVGSFYNNSSLNIATSSMLTFVNSGFMPTPTNIARSGAAMGMYSFYITTTGAVSLEDDDFVNGNCTNANPQVCTFNSGTWASTPKCLITISTTGTGNGFCNSVETTTSSSISCTNDAGGTSVTSYDKKVFCLGVRNGL